MKILESARIEKLAALFLISASVLLAAQAIDALMGIFEPRASYGNIITVEGRGEVVAIPDVASISFSVSEDAQTASLAQDAAAKKMNVALALLKNDLGIPESDIKTTSYSVYPKYSRPQPCYVGYCPDYEQIIVGYTASQSIEVKVRDTAKAGEALSKLGDAGVSNLYGPSFTVDDPAALQTEARAKAIENAREKAKTLAKDLKVSLVRVTGFWENQGYYPYSDKAVGLGGAAEGSASLPPELPTGESEITVVVSVSYEIR